MAELKVGGLAITLKRNVLANAGRIVRLLKYVGDIPAFDLKDAWSIQAVDGRPFASVTNWTSGRQVELRNTETQCLSSSRYLIPLFGPEGAIEHASAQTKKAELVDA